MAFNAIVSTQDLAEFYTPSFQSCVRDAKVGSIMCRCHSILSPYSHCSVTVAQSIYASQSSSFYSMTVERLPPSKFAFNRPFDTHTSMFSITITILTFPKQAHTMRSTVSLHAEARTSSKTSSATISSSVTTHGSHPTVTPLGTSSILTIIPLH